MSRLFDRDLCVAVNPRVEASTSSFLHVWCGGYVVRVWAWSRIAGYNRRGSATPAILVTCSNPSPHAGFSLPCSSPLPPVIS